MSILTQNIIKPESHGCYGYRRILFYDEYELNVPKHFMYILIPLATAKISSLVQKFTSLFGQVYYSIENPCQVRINVLFQYLLLRQILYDKICRKTNLQYSTHIEKAICQSIKLERIQKALKELALKVNNKIDLDLKQKWSQNLTKDQYIYKCKRTNQLKSFDQIISIYDQEYRPKISQYYLLYRRQQIRYEGDPAQMENYITFLMRQSQKIELLHYENQLEKFKRFDVTHQKYFTTKFYTEKNTKSNQNSYLLKLRRLIINSQPVQVNLQQLVELRQNGINYRKQSILMIKDLFQQLKVYNLQASQAKQSNYYYLLSPSSVLFDQISLTLKLHFEPLLWDALGVKKKPCSVEQKLVFFGTPKSFDFFQSPIEFEDQAQLILGDAYLNIEDLLKQQLDKSQLYKLKIFVQKLKEQMSVWRFLLTSYFLLNSTEFGKPNERLSYRQIKLQYIDKMQQLRKILGLNMANLSRLVGIQNISVEKKEFNFLMSQLNEFFTIETDDSVVKSNKLSNIKRYFSIRYSLLRQMLRLLKDAKQMNRLINSKRYLIMYYICVLEYLQEMLMTNKRQEERPGYRAEFTSFMTNYIKKFKQNKSTIEIAHSIFTNINKYKNHSSNKKTPDIDYINHDQIGKRMYIFTEKISNQIRYIQENDQELKKLSTSRNMRQQYLLKLQEFNAKIALLADKSRIILNQFMCLEVKQKKNKIRVDQRKSKEQRQLIQLDYRRFELIMHSFMTFTPDKSIQYESLLIPLFRIDEDEKSPYPITQEYLVQTRNIMQEIQELIEYPNNLQIVYLTHDSRMKQSQDSFHNKMNKIWENQIVSLNKTEE